MDIGRPRNAEICTGRDLGGGRDADLGADHLDRGGGLRAVAFVQHVADLIQSRICGGGELALGQIAHADIVGIGPLIGASGDDGDVVLRMDTGRPRYGESRTGRHRFRGGQGDIGGGFGIRGRFFGRLIDQALHLCQGVFQLMRIGGRHKETARIFGDTGKPRLRATVKIKAHHMRGESDTLTGQFLGQRAGIGLTGFQPVGNQHHRRGRIAIGQHIGGLLDCGTQRGFALGADAIHHIDEMAARYRAGRDQGFDIAAIAFGAVAIGDKPEIGIIRPAGDQIGHDIAGDLDLADAVNLPPHRARGIIDHHHIIRRQRGPDRQPRCGNSAKRHLHCFHAHLPPMRPYTLDRFPASGAAVLPWPTA